MDELNSLSATTLVE
jgi:hypothetical protein